MSSDIPNNPHASRGRSTQPQPRADRSGPPRKNPKRSTQSTSKYPYGADGGIFLSTTIGFERDPDADQPPLWSWAGCANLIVALILILLLVACALALIAQLPPTPGNL